MLDLCQGFATHLRRQEAHEHYLYPRAGPHGGRPRQRQQHAATPATDMGQRAPPPPGPWLLPFEATRQPSKGRP